MRIAILSLFVLWTVIICVCCLLFTVSRADNCSASCNPGALCYTLCSLFVCLFVCLQTLLRAAT
jgi:hypothetical protein